MSHTPPVSMRTDDVYSLAEALRLDAASFRVEAARLIGRFEQGGSESAWGVDERNVPAGHAVRRHRETQQRAVAMLRRATQTLHDMSASAHAVVTAFGDQDALNGADIDDVDRAMNPPASTSD
ncbi:MAG TPA: hypothetical protein VE172_16435 [Stackebrandtia sp.]|jgi:hypothetical protein|uniref:hypothetical protein n=1 Tax=Stackebrandtia sp. TaxID=2023065 RepID=UPI002D73E570|nr:hypothetical protein [Stackebrandtia sp.]HZE40391.1 hypothetical protein [Stackebrandtia sp.]